MKQTEQNQAENLDEEMETIKSLLNYPSLERVFDPADSRNLPTMRQKMQSTVDDLERVIRRGSQNDAKKAAAVVEAYKIVLGFLDELENARRNASR